jgi:GT2 family glycosyltransferase
VTVIVVNWNRRALLEAALRSLAQPQGAPFDVIVVDNGSTDGSPDWVSSWAAHAPYPITLIRNPANRGFCAANNQAIAATGAEFVALLNNDAEAAPGWLGALVSAFHDPQTGMAASKILVWEDPRIIDKVGHLIYPDGQNRGRGTGEIDRGQYDTPEEAAWPDGCACMYRRSMLEQIGGFDEDLFAYADDAELGLRARIAGWRCIYQPAAVVRHHRAATLGAASSQRLRLIERNRLLLAVKLFPGSLLWLNGAYTLARLLHGIWAGLRNEGESARLSSPLQKARAFLALLRGALEALPLIPRMWRKRKHLDRFRRLTPAETRRLILRYRISLRQLNRQAIPEL